MGKRCAAFSSAAESWQRDESFSRVLMVLAKSDSAATHTSSTLSVGGIILPVKSKHLILSFNHGCVGFKYRQNNGAMEKEQAMKTWSFPHPTSAPRANIHLKGLPR